MQTPARLDGLSMAQAIISGLGLLVCFLVIPLLMSFGQNVLAQSVVPTQEALVFFSLAWVSSLVALLLLPSLVMAVLRLSGRPFTRPLFPSGLRIASWLLIPWIFIIIGGEFLAQNPALSWRFLPPLQILAVGIPIWWFVEFGRRGLDIGTAQRTWGLITFNVAINPLVILAAEGVVILILAVFYSAWSSGQGDTFEQLMLTSQRLLYSEMNPEVLERVLRMYIQQPGIVVAILAIGAGMMPLVEELLKPLSLWLISSRLTPAGGFAAGLVCGGCFALLESLGMISSSMTGAGWSMLVLGRTGTALLHIITTALTGWGMALAWNERRYARMVLLFLLAVSLHGLWNLFNLAMAIAIFLPSASDSGKLFGIISQISPFGLFALAGVMFALLFGCNRILRSGKKVTTDEPG